MKLYLYNYGLSGPEERAVQKLWDRYSRSGVEADKPQDKCPQPRIVFSTSNKHRGGGRPKRLRLGQ